MKANEIAKEVMRQSGITQLEMSRRLGCKTQAVLASRLRGQDMKFDSFLEIIEQCGYSLVLKDPTGKEVYTFSTSADTNTLAPATPATMSSEDLDNLLG